MTDAAKMTGKRVLVTGSGTGLGREIALEFARQGAAVALHYSHSRGGAASAVAEIRASGGQAEAFPADFRLVPEVQQLAAAAVSFLGGLDVLVNNAGITMNQPFLKVTPEQFDTVYHVNIRAQFFLTQALVPELARNRGVVVNLSSIHAFQGASGHSVYAGTKGAIVACTRQLAIELGVMGIRVNGLAPGAIPVENHRKMGDVNMEALGRCIPCGFAGTPLDVARVAVFLASDDARYIVGQTIIMDGGATSWISFGEGFRQMTDAPFGRGYVPGI